MNETFFTVALLSVEIIFASMVLKTLRQAGAGKSMLMMTGFVFIMWLSSLVFLISNGLFTATGMPQVAFTAGVFIPVIVGYLLVRYWKPLGQAVNAMSTESFLRLQYWRAAFGVMFFFTSALPVWFQMIGGFGDIAAGAGAFLALRQLRQHPGKERRAIIKGNLVGILDFIVVLNLGLFVVLRTDSPDIMFNLIPLFVVPVFILLHIFSLRRLVIHRPVDGVLIQSR